MSENNVSNVAQENLSPETLAEIKLNPDTFTSGFVQTDPFPGQTVYDTLTNQPFNSQPLQSKLPPVSSVPGIPDNVNLSAWTNKQNENIIDKLNQAQSWGYNDYQDLKPYTFGTGAKHTNFDRYYHHPKFEELGFTPFRDNEALYNENSTVIDDLSRSMSQWDNIFASTIAGSYRSLGDVFTGDFLKPDEESAYALEEAMNIGYSSRGGIMGGFNNLVLQSSIPVAMGLDFLVSEMLLGLTGNISGMGLKGAQTGATIGKMSEILSNFPKLKQFYEGAKQAGKSALSFTLPNTVKNLAEYGPGSNKLLNFANTVGSFADFYKDVRNMNYALSESKLEGGLQKNKLANDLIFEHIQDFGQTPDDKTMSEIYDKAQDAGFTTTAINFPIILATNKLVFDNLFTTPKYGARNVIEIIEAGLKNGKKLIYDASKVGIGQAFKEVGILGATKASLKALTKPSTYLRNGASYFKANLTEGIQELAQEVISGSTYDYYKELYKDPSMGGVQYAIGDTINNIKKQMSPEGFEVFASGFFMGGLMNTMGFAVNAAKTGITRGMDSYYKSKNPEAYQNEYEKNKAKNAEIVNALNQLYQDPMQFFAPDKLALIENLRINKGLKNARNNGDEKEFMDFSDIAKFNGVYNALSLNRYDALLDMLKDMKQLDSAELKKALKLDDTISEEDARAILDKTINRATKIKSNYDALSKYENPFNPERFRKQQINKDPEVKEQYLAESFAYLGFDEAKKRAVFSVYGFDRAKERMQSIASGLSTNPAVEKAQFSDIMPLLSEADIISEITTLSSEIESLKDSTDDYNKKLYNKKQQKLEALLKILQNQSKYGQTQMFLDPESKKLFKDYFKTIADINDTFYEDQKVEDAVKAISDYYLLENEAKQFSNDVNTIFNPNAFYQMAAQEAAAFKKIYDEREQVIKDTIENFEKIKDNNEFLNLLYDANIALDPKYLDALKEDTTANIINLIEESEDIEFIDTLTNEIFTKKNTEKYARVEEVIADFKARKPEVIVETTEEETEEEIPEVSLEEAPAETTKIPVINNNIDFNKLPAKLKSVLTSANAQYNSELGNAPEESTKAFQFAGTKRGKEIITNFFNNPDNAADVEKYNNQSQPTETPPASVPLTITSQVRQQLYDLGYSKQDVDAMKPETAQDIIANQTTKPKVEEPVSDIETQKADIEKRRQEELNANKSTIPKSVRIVKGVDLNGEPTLAEVREMEDGSFQVRLLDNAGKRLGVINTYPSGVSVENAVDGVIDITEPFEVSEQTLEEARLTGKKDKINAKYDAELAALEQPAQTPKSFKTVRPELMGKVIYVTPASGKTPASLESDDVIDGDDLLYDEVVSLPEYTDITKKELPVILGILSSDPQTSDRVYNNALAKANQLASQGKTVLFGSRRLISEVDAVITSLPSEENNKRIVDKFVNSGQNIEGARRSLLNIRNSEKKVKNKIVIDSPFDEYIFSDEKPISKKETSSYEKLKEKLSNARTFDDVNALEMDFITQGFTSNVEQATEFDQLVQNKRKELKQNLNFDSVKVGDILLFTDNTKNNKVKEVTSTYILTFKPDGTMTTIMKGDDFNNKVNMIYNHEAENEDEKIIGVQSVETPTSEEKEKIDQNLQEYTDFTNDKDAILKASQEADNSSVEDIDNEFFNSLGC